MMTTLILAACLGGDGICQAPPINPRFNTFSSTVILASRNGTKTRTITRALCQCHGQGNNVCECARGSCGDPSCPTKPVPLSADTRQPTTVPAPQFSHYEYVRSCGPQGCTMQRVARYRVRRGR